MLPSFNCLDCGMDTSARSGVAEYYMVREPIWLVAFGLLEYRQRVGQIRHQKQKPKGMLCIGCLEDRLGRQLTPTDFTACPLNTAAYSKSERLRNRLGIV